jgi:hypothetical protein
MPGTAGGGKPHGLAAHVLFPVGQLQLAKVLRILLFGPARFQENLKSYSPPVLPLQMLKIFVTLGGWL